MKYYFDLSETSNDHKELVKVIEINSENGFDSEQVIFEKLDTLKNNIYSIMSVSNSPVKQLLIMADKKSLMMACLLKQLIIKQMESLEEDAHKFWQKTHLWLDSDKIIIKQKP